MATNKNKQRVTIFINPSIAKHAKAQAVVEELSLTNFIEKALIKYLPKETIIKKAEIKADFDF
jgi:peptide deformylase